MTNTRKLALVAILSALSFLLMFFQIPLIPGVDFLQMDFSIVPVLLGLVLMDLRASWTILIIRSLLKLLLNSAGVVTLIGLPLNLLAVGVFVLSFALLWQKTQTTKAFVLAAGVGTALMTGLMLLANYFYAVPIYRVVMGFDIKASLGLSNYLFAMVLPFNLLQGLCFTLAFGAVMLVMRPLLKTL